MKRILYFLLFFLPVLSFSQSYYYTNDGEKIKLLKHTNYYYDDETLVELIKEYNLKYQE